MLNAVTDSVTLFQAKRNRNFGLSWTKNDRTGKKDDAIVHHRETMANHNIRGEHHNEIMENKKKNERWINKKNCSNRFKGSQPIFILPKSVSSVDPPNFRVLVNIKVHESLMEGGRV
ncbi:hypothetical protein QL285_018202 [Trifolium repens]|jgi:hypothetical protein|nr:hypothetical protein QL285_018202 [Trifolium repens]